MLCRNKISAARVSRFPGKARAILGALPAKILGDTCIWGEERGRASGSLTRQICSHNIGKRAQKRYGGQVKMEKVLGLAVVSSMLCVGSVFGKYVRGIVNTKEVSNVIVFTFYHYCAGNGSEFSCVLQLRISWLLLGMGSYSKCVLTPLYLRASGSLML